LWLWMDLVSQVEVESHRTSAASNSNCCSMHRQHNDN
jgi:hypothetical protein